MKTLWVILLDSYRMMNARKLFWVCIAMSLMVGLGYASVEFDETGYSIGFGMIHFENEFLTKGSPMAQWFYVMIFNEFFVKLWLGGGAILLAIVATASIFPELTKEGAIEVTLSKPVGRWTIFLAKFFGGCLFTFLQSLLFVTIVFIAVGLRVEVWNVTLFWAVPLVTFVFSMLFCVSALIGVMFRSEIFAIIGTLMLWCLSWSAQSFELIAYDLEVVKPNAGYKLNMQTAQLEKLPKGTKPKEPKLLPIAQVLEKPLPKTRAGAELLKRFIVFPDSGSGLESIDFESLRGGRSQSSVLQSMNKELNQRHSTAYVIWGSLAFITVILAIAGFLFVRKDY